MFATHVMGCMICKLYKSFSGNGDESQLVTVESKKEYSWDKKPKVNPKDYTIENIVNGEVIREPNSVNGRQFIIQNCSNARIFVLDYCNSVTIDDCNDCQIVLGPMSGSLFVRGSENLTLVALCGQFRARDCRQVNAFLCCSSQPSIEACSKFEFGCASIQYKGLEGQISRSGSSIFNNQWNLVYDFTPVPSEGPNWHLISAEKAKTLALPGINEFSLTLGERTKSIVPRTVGDKNVSERIKSSLENCFIAIAHCSSQTEIAIRFVSSLSQSEVISLVQTKEMKILEEDFQIYFPSSLQSIGMNIIGLHFEGTNTRARCNQVSEEIISTHGMNTQEKIFISENNTKAVQMVKQFFGN